MMKMCIPDQQRSHSDAVSHGIPGQGQHGLELVMRCRLRVLELALSLRLGAQAFQRSIPRSESAHEPSMRNRLPRSGAEAATRGIAPVSPVRGREGRVWAQIVVEDRWSPAVTMAPVAWQGTLTFLAQRMGLLLRSRAAVRHHHRA